MFKLVSEKAEEPEIKLPTSTGSWKKQESSRKTSISALLTMPKPLSVWITINCGKFWKRWEYQTTWPASWETYMQVRKQQLELDMKQQTGSKWEKWSHSVMSDSLWLHGLQPARLLCPWDFLGNSTRVDCHFLLQGIFPTQGLNLGLPHCRQMLSHLSHEKDKENTNKKWIFPNSGMSAQKSEFICQKILLLCL